MMMSKFLTAIKLFKKDRGLFGASLLEKVNFLFPDKLYLKFLFRLRMGCKLNLKNPKSFNEKLQWLKLYDRTPLYTTLVDKNAVKDYVAQIIGSEHIVPTLGVWESAYDIDFNTLPNQFVLKTTNGGGGDVVICRNKSQLEINKVVRHLCRSLKKDIYERLREWPYKNVKRKIIAEEYLENERGDLIDYKIHVFNGSPQFILVCSNRFGSGLNENFYDIHWNLLDVCRPDHPVSKEKFAPPHTLNEMLDSAIKISKNIPFARVDFYEVKGQYYFGEVTFFPASGLAKFSPEKYDEIFGKMLNLNLR